MQKNLLVWFIARFIRAVVLMSDGLVVDYSVYDRKAVNKFQVTHCVLEEDILYHFAPVISSGNKE